VADALGCAAAGVLCCVFATPATRRRPHQDRDDRDDLGTRAALAASARDELGSSGAAV